MRKIFWIVSVPILLLSVLSVPYAIQAQDQSGSISGTVFRDVNDNGVCTGEGEPPVAANTPLELVQDDEGEIVRISTAADGTYAFSTNTLGLWRVTVAPGTGWRVTSQQTHEVVLTDDTPNVSNIDFCIIQVNLTPPGGGGLPESGAPLAPALLGAASMGFILMAAGAGLLLFNRKQKT